MIAFEYPGVQDAMMALTALHASRAKPSYWSSLEGRLIHADAAVTTANSHPEQPASIEWNKAEQTMNGLSSRGSITAIPPHDHAEMLDPLKWFQLSRGVLFLIKQWEDWVGPSWLSEAGAMYGEPDLSDDVELFRKDHQQGFEYLLFPVDGAEIKHQDKIAYERTLSYIGLMYKGVVNGTDSPLATGRRVMAMPARGPIRFGELVEANEPRAAAMLAHVFATMKLSEERFPWFEGIAVQSDFREAINVFRSHDLRFESPNSGSAAARTRREDCRVSVGKNVKLASAPLNMCHVESDSHVRLTMMSPVCHSRRVNQREPLKPRSSSLGASKWSVNAAVKINHAAAHAMGKVKDVTSNTSHHFDSGRSMVLFTGGTGFVATWVITQFLTSGYRVRTTVRTPAIGDKVMKTHAKVEQHLEYAVVYDITKLGAFDEAVKGVDGVVHTASPCGPIGEDDERDLLRPAIEGTKSNLRSVAENAPQVEKVVITSSFAAILDPKQGLHAGHTYSEKDWCSLTYEEAKTGDAVTGYLASKTFAEKAAHEFVEEHQPNFTIAAICPPMIYGPLAHTISIDTLNTSSADLWRFLDGSLSEKGIPETSYPVFVDVRDVAQAHLKAYEHDTKRNERYLVACGTYSYADVASALRKAFPERTHQIPDPKSAKPSEHYEVDNAKSRTELGLKYVPLEHCVADTGRSLIQVEETSKKGVFVNWLTARFIGSALQNFNSSSTAGLEGQQSDDRVAVLVVSWMRDLKFWQDEVRRVAGIDISKPLFAKRFAFVNCFNTTTPNTSLSDTQSLISSAISKLSTSTSSSEQETQEQKTPKILLILDQPDLLLATHNPTHPSLDLSTFLLNLRSIPQIHSTYLSLSADLPLITAAAASPETSSSSASPLETVSAAFIVTQAHASRVVFSVRELETGAAKDVSGVLRITRGGDYFAVGGDDDDEDEGDEGGKVKEAELLYLLQRDGGLKVFQRGE
ncbi:hypothetical protein CBER1_10801 [Cercospora berteroae]|uniref:NAD-dependent epimerase/dehydratase domain-containing protein n=1 Tax=Cercospora berteroae TaxID=357750 RepID=A0A2S6CIZ9_9PEZI|nr:hypothetical protein CBER1_10801 [Cercospora berteroae]